MKKGTLFGGLNGQQFLASTSDWNLTGSTSWERRIVSLIILDLKFVVDAGKLLNMNSLTRMKAAKAREFFAGIC